ncbi:MAG TPA: response regulator transcription factor [Anaerolineae bacterium]|nr:response regulator transcription factor [Anaerolineae bacterium]
MNILIVDDDQGFRRVVKRLLEAERELSVVGEAGDGEEAVRLARELRSDVVLMDIAMPRLDGLEATRRIKAEQSDAKVIILTIHGEEGYRRAAGASGADAFLLKKTLLTELLPTIRGIAP